MDTSATALPAENTLQMKAHERLEPRTGAFPATVFAVFVRLASASTEGLTRCFVDLSAVTSAASNVSMLMESSTRFEQLMPELQMQINELLDIANNELVEDGMHNAINTRLALLILKDYRHVIPAVASAIETTATPIVSAEVLKELGRFRNQAAHGLCLWTLEHFLGAASPITRDGAALGLARLGDSAAIPNLTGAAQRERDPQLRKDLELVIEELSEPKRDGIPAAEHQ
jgi:hypothetical protein